ncbi:unnamed protein product [marine sediment metagenome]|uniref:Uncharacterized protein n=1 Tax=marine sediment metagenome TaxID=412755 RepID=X1HIU3_9ZZZZ
MPFKLFVELNIDLIVLIVFKNLYIELYTKQHLILNILFS